MGIILIPSISPHTAFFFFYRLEDLILIAAVWYEEGEKACRRSVSDHSSSSTKQRPTLYYELWNTTTKNVFFGDF